MFVFLITQLTETWPNDTIFSHNFFPISSVFRANRDYLNSHTTREGGVLISVSNLLQGVMLRHDLETTEENVCGLKYLSVTSSVY
jgi:hypothetical protein